jgi:TonB family protein
MKMRTLLLCAPVFLAPAVAAGADPAPAPLALQALSSPRLNMPDVACQQRLSGFVELDFAVLPNGAVAEVRVTASEPKGLFDAAAVESVSGRTYPSQEAPIKARERLPLGPADCRVEQLKATAEVAPGFQMAPQECVALATQARSEGERFEPIDSGRAILGSIVAQVYAGPNAGCPVVGKSLTPGARWRAHLEYNGFSLISPPRADEAAAVWVRSNALKDVEVPGLAAAAPAVAVPVSLPAPAAAPASADLKQLLALHDTRLRAHLAGDAEQVVGAEAGEFVQANRGAVARADRVARKAQLGTYLKKTRFTVYRDQIPPIAKVSADGTLGWVIAQVEARGEQTGPDGTPEPLAFVSAWVELYEKRDGRWVAVGNVSNFKR